MGELKKTSERGFEFACRLIDEYRRRRPADDAERAIWWQLLKSGPSVGANSSESDGAQTDRDFITKFQTALKEGRETLFWLRVLKYASPDRTVPVNALFKQCDEIVAILVASLKTAKRNQQLRAQQRRRTTNDERRTPDGTKNRDQP